MPYVDLNTIHNPATGTVAPATWGDQIRDDFEFLIDPPMCTVYNNAAQGVTNNTLTVLNANSERVDNNGMHSTVTNNSRITIQTAGRYVLSLAILWEAFGSGFRYGEFFINGTTPLGCGTTPGVAGIAAGLAGSRETVLNVGDYVQVRTLFDGGANLSTTLEEFTAKYNTR